MILVDTSVWVDHFYCGDPELFDLLKAKQVLVHDYVVGELTMGRLTDRKAVMRSFEVLPHADVATHDEVLSLVEQHRLYGTGIGYVDAHILGSVLLTARCRLWTRDRRLKAQAERFGLAVPDLK